MRGWEALAPGGIPLPQDTPVKPHHDRATGRIASVDADFLLGGLSPRITPMHGTEGVHPSGDGTPGRGGADDYDEAIRGFPATLLVRVGVLIEGTQDSVRYDFCLTVVEPVRQPPQIRRVEKAREHEVLDFRGVGRRTIVGEDRPLRPLASSSKLAPYEIDSDRTGNGSPTDRHVRTGGTRLEPALGAGHRFGKRDYVVPSAAEQRDQLLALRSAVVKDVDPSIDAFARAPPLGGSALVDQLPRIPALAAEYQATFGWVGSSRSLPASEGAAHAQ